MALVSFPTITHSIGRVSHSLPTLPQSITASSFKHYENAHSFRCHRSQFSYQPLTRTSFSPRHEGLLPVPLNAKNSEAGEEDSKALETVLRLYSAIKKKSICELSDVIRDDCRCLCNFFSSFQPLQGKKVIRFRRTNPPFSQIATTSIHTFEGQFS